MVAFGFSLQLGWSVCAHQLRKKSMLKCLRLSIKLLIKRLGN